MLVVVTDTSGTFLERPRKKAIAMLGFDEVDNIWSAQVGEGIVLGEYVSIVHKCNLC